VDPAVLGSIRAIVRDDPAVKGIKKSLTMHFGPSEVLLTLDVRFKRQLTAEGVAEAVDRLEKKIRDRHPEIKYIFIEAKSLYER
jgi:divalent metal cation (Fe/Co/Zn/Cd) transporter